MVHPKSTRKRVWNSLSLGIKQLWYSCFLMKGLQAFVLCLWYIKYLPWLPLTHYFSFQRFLCFELICLLFSQITLRFRGLPWFNRPLCLQTLPLVGFYSSLSIMIAKFNLMSEESHVPDSRRNLLSSFPVSSSNSAFGLFMLLLKTCKLASNLSKSGLKNNACLHLGNASMHLQKKLETL